MLARRRLRRRGLPPGSSWPRRSASRRTPIGGANYEQSFQFRPRQRKAPPVVSGRAFYTTNAKQASGNRDRNIGAVAVLRAMAPRSHVEPSGGALAAGVAVLGDPSAWYALL